jgi:hypothetical protein
MQKRKPELKVTIEYPKKLTRDQEEELKKKMESTFVLFFPELGIESDIKVVPKYKAHAQYKAYSRGRK